MSASITDICVHTIYASRFECAVFVHYHVHSTATRVITGPTVSPCHHCVTMQHDSFTYLCGAVLK